MRIFIYLIIYYLLLHLIVGTSNDKPNTNITPPSSSFALVWQNKAQIRQKRFILTIGAILAVSYYAFKLKNNERKALKGIQTRFHVIPMSEVHVLHQAAANKGLEEIEATRPIRPAAEKPSRGNRFASFLKKKIRKSNKI